MSAKSQVPWHRANGVPCQTKSGFISSEETRRILIKIKPTALKLTQVVPRYPYHITRVTSQVIDNSYSELRKPVSIFQFQLMLN